MSAGPSESQLRRLSEWWDQRLRGVRTDAADEAGWQRSIDEIERLLRVPAPDPSAMANIWQQLTGTELTVPLEYTTAPWLSPNGRVSPSLTAPALAIGVRVHRDRAWALYRLIVVGALAGLFGGAIAGLVSRLAMRLAGAMTVDANRHLLTENDAIVGKITFGGSFFLVAMAAVIGLGGGIVYLALRRWLPGSGAIRALGYGGGLLLVLGFVVMDETNPDYHLFGPEWANVSSFSAMYVIFGFCVGVAADWLDARVPPLSQLGWPKRALFVVGGLPLMLLAAAGLLAAVSAFVPFGLPAIALLLIVTGLTAAAGRLRRFVDWLHRYPAVGYAAVAAPCLAGAVLTVRAIVTIMGGV